ncbi:hypothetical protein GN958_ATG11765, partial [Phytophthora infestans]
MCNKKVSFGSTKSYQSETFWKADFWTAAAAEVQHRLVGWSHPHLMDRMKQCQSSLFVDATYRCVPTPFYQLVIVLLYDSIS